MAVHEMYETFQMLTLFLKILLALASALLLFLDDGSLGDRLNIKPSKLTLVSEGCLFVTFVASLILVACWDTPLAILVCLFITSWIVVVRNSKRKTPHQRGVDSLEGQPAFVADTDTDNDAQYMYSINSPIPHQQSIPMAFTLSDTNYSNTSV